MAFDSGPIGTVAAEIMDTLDGDVFPEGANVEEVLVIVAVTWPDGEDSTGSSTYYRCSSDRIWVQKGLLDQARSAMEFSARPAEGGEDEE